MRRLFIGEIKEHCTVEGVWMIHDGYNHSIYLFSCTDWSMVYMILYTEVLDLPDNLAKNFVTE